MFTVTLICTIVRVQYACMLVGCLKGQPIILDEDDIRLKRKGAKSFNH